ncbi:MAG TPA: AmmeMemoRadiSam system protein A [Thermoanaerobaculia bacterium]|nr:AmmeMemoRadiSam system protein A [Thermoanaerobaculia bacterium]
MSDRERGRVLVAIARESIEEALGLRTAAAWDDPWLFEPGACFITLMRRGTLRGCVGSVRAYRPLYEDVRANARASAFHDTRFPPVDRAECPELRVEVSLLSAPEPVSFSGEAEALAALRPEVDGIIFEAGGTRSTFLPQVWQQLPDPRDFLGQLKLKAGLSRGFWSPDVKLWRYTVTKWIEGE